MNEVLYKGEATLPDGKKIEVIGTITQCANWADNVIRAGNGDVQIKVTALPESHERRKDTWQ